MAITQLGYDLDEALAEPDPSPATRQAPTIPDEVAGAVEIADRRSAHFDALIRAYDLPDLLGAILARRPGWMADALCREHPEINFYPVRGEDAGPAKAICAACLVQQDCVAYATARGEKHGIWGGTSGRGRRGHVEVSQAGDLLVG